VRFVLLTVALALASCGKSVDVVDAQPNHVTAAQIRDVAGPTVAELQRRGLVRIDDEETGWTGPAGETVDGFTAIYVGKDLPRPTESDRQFICPVGDGDMETWKCVPYENQLKKSNG
jgi:hypothetical protein